LRIYLARYAASGAFRTLAADTEKVEAALASIAYCMRVRDGAVTVTAYDGEADYSTEVEDIFAKFRQGAVTDYRDKYSELTGANHIEAQIAELVAKLKSSDFRGV
jgi:DNA mismatch repair protein MutS